MRAARHRPHGHPRAWVTTALAVAPLTAACAAVQPPPADLASRHVGRPAQFAEAPEVSASDQTTEGWLATFADPELTALVHEAWEHNPDLFVAAERFREAEARMRIVGARLAPQLDAAASADRLDIGDGPTERYAVGLQAAWEIDLWGRLGADRAAATQIAQAVGLELELARLSLAASVATAYYGVVFAEAQLAVDRELLAAEEFTAVTTRQRVLAGLGTSLDEDLAESNVQLAEVSIQADLATLADARRALEILVGRYPAGALASKVVLPALPPDALSVGVPSELLERRPDVQSAARAVDAAYYTAASARAARLPSLTLSGSIGATIDPTDIVSSVLAQMFAPLATGGRITAEIDAADAVQRQALGRYAAVALDAFREVESALSDARHLAARGAQLEVASERLRRANTAAQGRYEQGLLSILDLQQVRRSDFLARLQLLAVRFQQLRRRIDLHLALGGPAELDVPSSSELHVGVATPQSTSLPATSPQIEASDEH